MIANIKIDIMATLDCSKTADPLVENRLRQRRQALGLSQKQLAAMAGITRQAVSAVEGNQYSPATSVSLQLARALKCRVEDLFSIPTSETIVDGDLTGTLSKGAERARVQVMHIGDRVRIRPLDGEGELTSLACSADGVMVGIGFHGKRARVKLLKDPEAVRRQLVIGGCDPAMFVAAEHLRKHDRNNLVPCLMGNSLALEALRRSEVHLAGVHWAAEDTGNSNLFDLHRKLAGMNCDVVTFAHWEEGIIVRRGNPKKIRAVADLVRATVKIINREKGSGARRLLDNQLKAAGIPPSRIKGYRDEVLSHLEVASRLKTGFADAGIGVRAAAAIYGLDFVPLQRERYDLIIPKAHHETLPGLKVLLDIIVSRRFQDEIEALGGYDTRDSGKVVDIR